MTVPIKHHERYMKQALALAEEALAQGEVPVGAVVVKAHRVIGTGYNARELTHDPTGHAEIVAIRRAAETLGSWRLEGCTLYVTLEPCAMCAGAVINSRVETLVFGCLDPKAGAVRTLYALCEDPRLNHRVAVRGGILAEPCSEILSRFFQSLRNG